MTRTLLLAAVVLLAGCRSLVPTSRQENAATRVADSANSKAAFEFAGKIHPSNWPSVTVSNIGKGTVSIATPPAVESNAKQTVGASAGSRDRSIYEMSLTIPLFVKIIGIAIGLVLLLFAIKSWVAYIKKSATGRALLVNDRLFADQIDKVSAKLATSVNPQTNAELLVERADLEKKRGKNAREIPADLKPIG